MRCESSRLLLDWRQFMLILSWCLSNEVKARCAYITGLPLAMRERELHSNPELASAMQEAAAAVAASSAEAKTPKDKDKAIKDLIRSIPRDRKDVFAYSLKWDAFDEHSDAILPKLSKWVRCLILPSTLKPCLFCRRSCRSL